METNTTPKRKQTTRMRKVICENCGCICRMTRKWIKGAGLPTCACGTRMEWAEWLATPEGKQP